METRIDTDVAEMMHCGRYEWESNIGSYGGGGKIICGIACPCVMIACRERKSRSERRGLRAVGHNMACTPPRDMQSGGGAEGRKEKCKRIMPLPSWMRQSARSPTSPYSSRTPAADNSPSSDTRGVQAYDAEGREKGS